MDCFAPPFSIYFDVLALTKSATRDGTFFLHPSIPTAFNEHQLVRNQSDADEILSEISTGALAETILQRHHIVRTSGKAEATLISSNVTIDRIICIWAYIAPLKA